MISGAALLSVRKSRRDKVAPPRTDLGARETGLNDLSGAPRPTEIEVVEAKEAWSEYRLADGTVLRVKPIMIAVTRVDGAETADGEPVYNMKSTLVTDVRGAKTPPNSGPNPE
jgi:hypothetical protein